LGQRILIIEDQFLIAIALEDAILALGHHVAGIAASRSDVLRISEIADIALVDINLLDGPTGPEIGRELAQQGCEVVFMTANPEAVRDGIEGTIGVICKPVMDLDLVNVIQYAASRREGAGVPAPKNLRLFT
jgi:two-component system, response regulator PdtaR